jgi:hypothetical protein
MNLLRFVAAFAVTLFSLTIQAQTTTTPATTTPQTTTKHWYEVIKLRGYSQMRYNRLAESNENYKCESCDRSIGKGQEFSVRRARLVFSGNPTDRLFVYLQYDFSVDASATAKNFLQVRDAYFDYAFTKDKLIRARFGQSKVPYGFENLQSSSNRITFDRDDALNSAVPNERDLGVFIMVTPKKVQDLLKKIMDDGLKGAGDYGMLTFGVYNGQSSNKPELNNGVHAVARFTYPFQVKNQIIEAGVQAYKGKFTLDKGQLTPKAVGVPDVKYISDLTYDDQRVAGSFVLYPQPIGIQAEYNVGKSPTFNPNTDSIETKNLKGGYVMMMYRTKVKGNTLIPFVRYQWYDGAKKIETDARNQQIAETSAGVEWQINKNFEVTAEYMIGHRKTQDNKVRAYDEKGSLLRLQAQFSF